MPLYEYKCQSCGDVFEVKQKFADEPLKVHPNCGGTVERLLSASSFQLKGSGWYVTDYARSKSNGNSKSESSESKPAESKSAESKSADTKSSAKSDSTTTTTK